jgi:phosphotransferase system enzyme I (PtsI)
MKFLPTGRAPLVSVLANIGSLAEATAAASSAATGVGLFRTEMLYLTRTSRPSVSQQAADYSEVFSASPGRPLIARTLDSAKDKQLPFLSQHDGTSQVPREFLLEQLSALEQARISSGKEVWVMAPMIASLKEARDFVKLARSAGDFKVGIMVEMPSVIADLPRLGGLVDFVSVGTNDLAKFLFQVERDESSGSELLNHWQPALISALAEIAESSAAAGIQSGVCGESAADPLFSIVLAGLGFSSVSVAPALVGQVRAALSSMTEDQAVLVAEAALQGQSPAQSKSLALEMLTKLED